MRELIRSGTFSKEAVILSIVYLVTLFITIKYIWNHVLTKYITILKPVTSNIDTILLAVGLWILI